MKSARADSEGFCSQAKTGKRRNTACISRFSVCGMGAKDPLLSRRRLIQSFLILQIRARGLRGSGNTGLTIFSSFLFLRLHSFLRPLPFFGFLLAVDGSLALGLFPDAPELARLVRMLGERQPRLRHSRLPASEAPGISRGHGVCPSSSAYLRR